MVQSGKRRLRGGGVKGKTAAKAGNPFEATSLNGVVLRIKKSISDHIRHFT